MIRVRSLALLLAIAAVPTFAATTQPAELPVKSVTLYTSGVGFFQHDGPVTGDGRVTLKFKTAQINDIIKSLVAADAGGRVTGVQYPSQDPLDKILKTFQIDLTGDASLANILSQLRGANVTALFADRAKVSGTVLSVENRINPNVPPMPPTQTVVLNLFDGNGIRQIDLLDVQTVELDNPVLKDELARALAAVAAGRDQDKKPVTIAFTGQGEHQLSIGYVVETPVWKTTYRLLLKDPAAPDKKAEDRLQGWAVVENQTDSDWNDITLSLVSGRPISFKMDLYQPIYIDRPTVELDLFQGLKPPVYRLGMNNAYFNQPAEAQAGSREADVAAAPAAAAPMTLSRMAKQAERDRFGLADSPQAAAVGARLGELFQYTIDHVTLARQQSSLVPIVTDSVGTEALSIYNETVLPRNPLNGVMLTNTTGKLLPQGPITVLQGGTYAGDSRIEDLPAGQKRLLSFGVDLQTLVDVKSESTSDLVGGKIVKGVLQLSRRQWKKKTYTIENKGDHDRTVILEHPLQENWKLVDTAEPMETTNARYRFKTTVPKAKAIKLPVTQETIIAQTLVILDGDLNGLVFQSKQAAIPQKVRDALVEAIAKRQALTDLEQQAKTKAQQIADIGTEQQRIRENMRTVDRNGQYYARLLAKLNDQESRIETLQKERDDLDAKAKEARAAFEKYLETLNVG